MTRIPTLAAALLALTTASLSPGAASADTPPLFPVVSQNSIGVCVDRSGDFGELMGRGSRECMTGCFSSHSRSSFSS
jgi:hypothetical protein